MLSIRNQPLHHFCLLSKGFVMFIVLCMIHPFGYMFCLDTLSHRSWLCQSLECMLLNHRTSKYLLLYTLWLLLDKTLSLFVHFYHILIPLPSFLHRILGEELITICSFFHLDFLLSLVFLLHI